MNAPSCVPTTMVLPLSLNAMCVTPRLKGTFGMSFHVRPASSLIFVPNQMTSGFVGWNAGPHRVDPFVCRKSTIRQLLPPSSER